jgi:hypothetical protein
MSATDALRSFAESRENDAIIIRDGLCYGDVRQAVAEIERLRAAVQAGRDVMAIIHGDDGSYRETHGDRKAADDAIKIVSGLRAERDALLERGWDEPKADLGRPESALPCGHPASLAINSAETGEFLYCELCDDKSARRDAEQRERELIAERDALRELLKRARLYLGPETTKYSDYQTYEVSGGTAIVELCNEIDAALGKEKL